MQDFVKTGISDFDNLFEYGGYPRGNQILVTGGPGSGKSIFCAQFVYNGAKLYDEPGVYITLESPMEKFVRNASVFGWDFRRLESDGKIRLLDSASFRPKLAKGEEYLFDVDLLKEEMEVENISDIIERSIREISARRLVIDSLSLIGLHTEDEFALRTKLLRLSEVLSMRGVTSLIISEARKKSLGEEDYPVEMFMFDGIITLDLDKETKGRKIAVNKMRGAKHVIGAFPFKITHAGVEIVP